MARDAPIGGPGIARHARSYSGKTDTEILEMGQNP